ncbi:MAG: hypothetical protein JSS59_06105 [Proteobacteria bacterium]|uniref:hypothetical protein n=1 Tax=Rudaea sp. TaxID=2136325 RepID=UPI00378341C5|nr:hypothetical protein [Pseudomonadota bacterium]
MSKPSLIDKLDHALFNAIYSRSLVCNTCREDPAIDRRALALGPEADFHGRREFSPDRAAELKIADPCAGLQRLLRDLRRGPSAGLRQSLPAEAACATFTVRADLAGHAS